MEDSNRISNIQYAINTIFAAIIAGFATWPIEVKKNALQRGIKNPYYHISNTFNRGFKGLAGCGPYVLYKVLDIAAQRAIQEPIARELKDRDYNSYQSYGTAGLISGPCGAILVTGLEQVKLSVNSGDFKSTPEAIRGIYHRFGFRGFFYGLKPTFARNIVYDPTNMLIRLALADLARASGIVEPDSALGNALLDSVAGPAAGSVNYSLDVIKTRWQSDMVKRKNSRLPTPQLGKMFIDIIKKEGPKALYGGFRAKQVLFFSSWFIYGGTKHLFDNYSLHGSFFHSDNQSKTQSKEKNHTPKP